LNILGDTNYRVSEKNNQVLLDASKLSANEEDDEAEEDEEEVEIPENEKNTCLNNITSLLQETTSTGKPSTGGVAKELKEACELYVENVGLIKTAITEKQTLLLKKQCSQAPYGKKTETIVDKKVRDTYQLNPGQIEIEIQLQALINRVAIEMGCNNRRVEGKLYKLLFYSKGGHFKKHRDTEKEKNMFATLIIQLPSVYTGGELIVHCDDDKATTAQKRKNLILA
jgi:hypothetical protein